MGPQTKVFDIWRSPAIDAGFHPPGAVYHPGTRHAPAGVDAEIVPSKKELHEETPSKPPGQRHYNKWLVVSAGAILATIAVAGGFLFAYHGSLAPVYLGGVPVSSRSTASALQAKTDKALGAYKLSIKNVSGQVSSYPLTKVGITVDSRASATQAKEQLQKYYLQRLEWWKPINIPLSIKVDKDVFQNFLNQSVIKANQPYKNASLAINGSSVSITAESDGQGQTLANPQQTLGAAIADLSTRPVQLVNSTIKAPIRAADLKDEKAKLEGILNQKITLAIGGTSVTPSAADIAGWLDLSPVEHDRTIDIAVNSGKVQSYLDKIAKPYVQPPRSKLIMTQSDGSITVLDPGADGIDIVNKDKTASTIASEVLGAKGLNQNLDVNYAARKTVEVKPYDKWIVVDVTTKRMYAYEQTNLVKSFLVSAGAPKTPTVLGQFSIYTKFRSQDMRGSNADGSRYYQPNVEWVNYFYKDYAIHGNYWRPLSWFGNINSSHGCVGVVNSDAEWIYNWAPIGTPVIVHQ